MGLSLVDESKVDPLNSNPNISFKNREINRYNELILSFCLKHELEFIAVDRLWDESSAKEYLEDGLHPNNAGHKLIANQVLSTFRKNGFII